MSTSNRIEINPEIMLGKPVIRGTRITVELLLRSLSEGATEADLLEAYPHLTHEDIQAAIAYAADAVGRERQTPLNNRAQRGLFAVRFLADESCDAALVRVLRAAGHDVISIAETGAARWIVESSVSPRSSFLERLSPAPDDP